MSAFTTLTISRSAALAKLAEVDINDLPAETGTFLWHQLGLFQDLDGQLRMIQSWEDLNNENLEKVLDKLFENHLYNFIVQNPWCGSERWDDKTLAALVIPSVSREKPYQLSSEDQVLHNQLQEKGFKTKDILALFATRE